MRLLGRARGTRKVGEDPQPTSYYELLAQRSFERPRAQNQVEEFHWTSRAITSPRPTTGARTAIAASPRPRGRGRPSSWSTRFTTIGGEQINDDNETRSPTLRRAGLRPQWRSHVGQTYPIPNKPIAPKRFHPTSKIFSAVTYFCVIMNTPKGRDAAAGPNCRKSSRGCR